METIKNVLKKYGETVSVHWDGEFCEIRYYGIAVATINFSNKTAVFYDMDSHQSLFYDVMDIYDRRLKALTRILTTLIRLLNENYLVRLIDTMILEKKFFVFRKVRQDRKNLIRMCNDTKRLLKDNEDTVELLYGKRKDFFLALNNMATDLYQGLAKNNFVLDLHSLKERQEYAAAIQVYAQYA